MSMFGAGFEQGMEKKKLAKRAGLAGKVDFCTEGKKWGEGFPTYKLYHKGGGC